MFLNSCPEPLHPKQCNIQSNSDDSSSYKYILHGPYETVVYFLLLASYLTLKIKESQLVHVLVVVLATLINVIINEK